jgi:YjbE family integral membrane protein
MAEVMTPEFWIGLMTIIWVNIVLSGDNAVVIALAARSLPRDQQKKTIFWGAIAAVVLRIILTLFVVALLQYPYLRIIGGLLLFWIAVKLQIPEHGDDDIESSSTLLQAIKTILIADLVMSLDNVIAVAAAAKDSITLLVLGLLISIPLVVFGATMLMKMMERYPSIITIGAALIGYVSGEMPVTDPAVVEWFAVNARWLIDFEVLTVGAMKLKLSAAGLIAGAFVVALGRSLAARQTRAGLGA